MNPSVDPDSARVLDVWLCALIFLLIYLFAPLLLSSFLKPLFPPLSSKLIDLIAIILATLIPMVYFAFRYGAVNATDLVPRITDIPILFGALVVIFVAAALGILGGGWRTEISHELRALGGIQSFLGFSIVIIFGPFLEETFFRKYVLEILRHKYPILMAVLITVALETGFHIGYLRHGIKPLVHIFCYSLFFTGVYMKSRLVISVIAHSLLNCYISLLAL